ncbi:hypothetical protein ACIBED_10985 [Rhodococcus coprophilus]|uniref:Uncharacterized protein n=1 Tax=Rhodococcus coprophilus TaxID=38310 RepID=A0A2X4TZQ9_9NOCA|nr:hypothetical protein [Rhodococcus coprophilus]MBM7458292.1 hypothetical protein [Rhodococcus coprophilus]SQI31919.1 Uncharacterised protein [Rhodococcus coprophilus]
MTESDPARVSMPRRLFWYLVLAGVLVGAGLGFTATPVGRWTVEMLPVVPGPFAIVAETITRWPVPILSGAVLIAGAVLGVVALRRSPTVTVDSTGVRLTQKDAEKYVARTDVSAVYLDGKHLVLTDSSGRELARHVDDDLDTDAVGAAFRDHGYPWADTNPHDNFTLWVDGRRDLGERAHELLRKRRAALEDRRIHVAAALHDQLQKHGVVVRDIDDRQEYRRVN